MQATLTVAALENAVKRRKPLATIAHSDRGAQLLQKQTTKRCQLNTEQTQQMGKQISKVLECCSSLIFFVIHFYHLYILVFFAKTFVLLQLQKK